MKFKQITDKILCFEEPNFKANIYYIDDVKKVQIDAGLALERPVDLLILTHCHVDHIARAAEVKRKNPNCSIAASEEAAAHIKAMDEAVIQPVEKFKVDLILGNGTQIYAGQYKFKILKVPGHTSGCIAIYEPIYKILFSGDCWFGNDNIGRWDLPTGNLRELKKSVQMLQSLNPSLLCPGHSY
ncbi:MAG: MBL fold metallo-hydrolase [Candidatus Nanoarchaeia archaeon]